MNKNYGVIIHPEDFSDFEEMSAEEAGLIVKNMIRAFKGEEVTEFSDRYLKRVSKGVCQRVVYDKGRSEKGMICGSQGGAPKGNQNAKKTTQKQPKNNLKSTEKQAKTTLNNNINNNNKNNYIGFRTNNFVRGCTKSDIDFNELENKIVKNGGD